MDAENGARLAGGVEQRDLLVGVVIAVHHNFDRISGGIVLGEHLDGVDLVRRELALVRVADPDDAVLVLGDVGLRFQFGAQVLRQEVC